jgi:tetratricopeptide (TPR) repeat protein
MHHDYATAASFQEITLSLVTRAFGPDAAETAQALNNLALTYYYLARYMEAEPLFRRAIDIGEKVLGKDHPSVAISRPATGPPIHGYCSNVRRRQKCLL